MIDKIRSQIDFLRVSSAGKFDEMADTMEKMLAVVEASRSYFNPRTDGGDEIEALSNALAILDEYAKTIR